MGNKIEKEVFRVLRKEMNMPAYLSAEQMPVTEGMNKLNDMLNLMIEPSVQPGQGGTASLANNDWTKK